MNKQHVPIIVGNWKATPATLKEATAFIKKLDKKCIASKIKLPKKAYYLAVPEIFIPHIKDIIHSGYVGSETVSGTTVGQVTGTTTPSMLMSAGADFVIIGHSEVRAAGEGEQERMYKVSFALMAKIPTILCVGEKARDKEGKYLQELEADVRQSLSLVSRDLLSNLIIAYEPVWAIGAKEPATAKECFEVVITLRRALATIASIDYAKKVHILYGGSVSTENAVQFIEEGGVDGLLLGRASQNVDTFFDIITECYTK